MATANGSVMEHSEEAVMAEPDPKKDPPKDPPPKDPDKPDPAKPADPPPGDDVPAMKDALRKANKEAGDLRAKLKELEDRDKSETEKLADRVAAAEKRADEAEARVMRAEIAIAKNLKPELHKFITGATREEMEAAADELAKAVGAGSGGDGKPGGDGTQPNPNSRPKEDLRGGGDPTQPGSPDIRKVIAEIPR